MLNSCWFLFKWGLLGAAIGVAFSIPQLNRQVGDEFRRRVESQFARHYDGLKATARSVELVPGRGIVVRGLTLVEPGAEGPRAELMHVEEVLVTCQTDLEKLIQGELEITQLVFRRPTIRMTRRPDGSWSTARLLHPRQLDRRTPDVRIEGGSIEIFDPLKNPSSTFTLREINCMLIPDRSTAASAGSLPSYRFQGTLAGDLLRQVEFSGMLDPQTSQWSLAGTVEGLEFSPELYHALPGEWTAKLRSLESFRGQGQVNFQIAHHPDDAEPYRFRCTARVARGRFEDPRLPHPLTEIHGTVVCTEEGVVVDRLTARSGSAALQWSGRRSGYEEKSPMSVQCELRGLELDQEMFHALPDRLRQQWHRFLPAGQINADVKLDYDGRAWQPELSIQCLNVSFTYDKFPYRLEHGRGSVELKGDVFTANLSAYSGDQPVRVSAEMRRPLDNSYGWVEAKAETIPLDEKLLNAIPGKARSAIRSLEPRGSVGFVVRAWRERPEEIWHRRVLVGVNRCAIRYEKFPYPIGNIRGTLEMNDSDWTFRDLEGTNRSGRLAGDGRLTATPDGSELVLRIAGTGITLEDELRDALKPGMQQVWNNLQPQGLVDLQADISYLSAAEQFRVNLRAEPRSENASIKPHYFPYRLERLHGILTYRDGRVTIEQFRGEHGTTRASSTGRCDFLPDGSWRFQLQDLTVERLRLDRELAAALPGRLKKAIAELNPSGPIHVRGAFTLAQNGKPQDPLTTQWDLLVGFQQASIDFGLKLQSLHGEMRLAGACDGDRFYSRGELAIDSAMYRDFQLTRITGPVWIDDQRVLFGTWVDRPQPGQPAAPAAEKPRPPRPIAAQLFGGALVCDGWVALGATPRYALRAELSQGDLARCAREMGSGGQDLRGLIHATADLHGSGHSLNLLGGHGKVQLSDADIYELPLMIALLKMLRTRRPDRSAFSNSDIDFRVEGNNVYFDRVKFSGDTISLVGDGEMNLQGEVRMKLHAMVGRGERDLPLLHDLIGGASQQIMLIHVGGTLQNPETSREPFPGIARALQQLQNDLDADSPRRQPRKR